MNYSDAAEPAAKRRKIDKTPQGSQSSQKAQGLGSQPSFADVLEKLNTESEGSASACQSFWIWLFTDYAIR